MSTEIPRRRSIPRWLWECPAVVGGFGLVVLGALDGTEVQLGMTAVSKVGLGALILLTGIGKLGQSRGDESQKSDLTPLDGIVVALHEVLVSGVGKKFDNPKLRICVHAPDGRGHFEQLTEYFDGKFSKGKTGRKVRIEKGVVGEAIRLGKTAIAKVPKGGDRTTYLMQSCGYTREEVPGLRPDANVWIAVVVGEPGCIIGVIFCDAIPREFFGQRNKNRWNVLHAAALGVAEFISDRYK